MAKLTLVDGTVFEGTTEEIFAITERYGSKQADEPAKEPFAIGDLVEIIDADDSDLSLGDIGEITDIDNDDLPYCVHTYDDFDYFPASALRKITSEEAEAKSEKKAVFARLGRNPGEYKKGDIARVTEEGSHDFLLGDVIEIEIVNEYGGQHKARYINGIDVDCPYVYVREIELIAPVESRVDAS